MSELKLFGKTICFLSSQVSCADDCSASDSDHELNREPSKDDASEKITGEEGDKNESDTRDKTLKKPDKILPCPRCKSMDTKFCYYNNYNATQPRHFCKNCQRYWTAGGTMRNVPVGAGRRKNKNASASHYHPITVPEALHNPAVLTFGGKDSGDDRSSGCGSSITASNSSDKVANSRLHEETVKNYHQGCPPQVPWFSGSPWPCAWSPVPWNSALHPVSFYPAPTYWGCPGTGSWNMAHVSPSPTVLGKHLREEPETESNNSIWVPKTLRMDDPSEAAKSSIRATFGIWNEKTSCMSGGGLFESFQSAAPLHANPAAMSRSLKFQEST